MASETKKKVELEVVYVLFIDIVGYSKLLINEQSEQIQTLREIVRGTEQFRLAEAADRSFKFRRATAARSSFATVRKRQFCARWKSARR